MLLHWAILLISSLKNLRLAPHGLRMVRLRMVPPKFLLINSLRSPADFKQQLKLSRASHQQQLKEMKSSQISQVSNKTQPPHSSTSSCKSFLWRSLWKSIDKDTNKSSSRDFWLLPPYLNSRVNLQPWMSSVYNTQDSLRLWSIILMVTSAQRSKLIMMTLEIKPSDLLTQLCSTISSVLTVPEET